MPQFKSISELKKHILNLANQNPNDSNLKDTIAETMHDVIETNVYDAFNPKSYERRGDKGGFSDVNNMVFTDTQINGDKLQMTFENITTGADSMYGERIDETLEYGIENNWDNPEVYDDWGRKNSAPRPFIEDTRDELQYRKSELTDALKKDLREKGFKVK